MDFDDTKMRFLENKAAVVDCLDPIYLSADEEDAREIEEIKMKQTFETVNSIEIDHPNIPKDLVDFLADIKNREKIPLQEEKEREDFSKKVNQKNDEVYKEKKPNRQRKHNVRSDKTVAARKKYRNSSTEESLVANDYNSTSKFQLPRSKSPPIRPLKRLKSGIVVGHRISVIVGERRRFRRISSNEASTRSSVGSSFDSPIFEEDLNLPRSESPPNRPFKCLESGIVLGHKRHESSDSDYRIRTNAAKPKKLSKRLNSPTIRLKKRKYLNTSNKRRSESRSQSPHANSPTIRIKKRKYLYTSNKRRSESRSQSPGTNSPFIRLKKRKYLYTSNKRRSAGRSQSPVANRKSNHKPDRYLHSTRRSPIQRHNRNRSSSSSFSSRPKSRSVSSSDDKYDRRRSSTRPKYEKRPQNAKHYGPDRVRVRKSPIREKQKKSFVHSPVRGRSSSSHFQDEDFHPIRRCKKEGEKRPQSANRDRSVSSDRVRVRKSPIRDKQKKSFVHSPARGSSSSRLQYEDLQPIRRCKKEEGEKTLSVKKESVTRLKDQVPYIKSEHIKSEFPVQKGVVLNTYYCQECQLGLTSAVTWHSHINGKSHAKRLKLLTVDEIAKGSIAVPSTAALISKDMPRFADAAPGRKRHITDDVARLQPAIDDVTDRPIPGLDRVHEIISENDINYYCELCDAPCGPSSIMPHLIGSKHFLRCFKELSPNSHENDRYEVKKKLARYERKYGRGKIKVILEVDDPLSKPIYDLPGTSCRNVAISTVVNKMEEGERVIAIKDEYLDTSKCGFFCKLCDSQMNNVIMWEAHIKGRRHLAKTKNNPFLLESFDKNRSVKIPNVCSKLEKLLDETAKDEIIVGLDFMKETQGINGEQYNCYLCSSCCTNYDIIDHILLPKHRLRYLEKLATEGKPNSINLIKQLEFANPAMRSSLIDEECREMLKKYGRGKIDVYKSTI